MNGVLALTVTAAANPPPSSTLWQRRLAPVASEREVSSLMYVCTLLLLNSLRNLFGCKVRAEAADGDVLAQGFLCVARPCVA